MKSRIQQSITHDFIVNAEAFIGLYEPLFLIKERLLKHCHGVWADWDVRVRNLDNAEAFLKRELFPR